jgi:hypothetical protein
MQKATFVLALLAFVLALGAWLRPYPPTLGFGCTATDCLIRWCGSSSAIHNSP